MLLPSQCERALIISTLFHKSIVNYTTETKLGYEVEIAEDAILHAKETVHLYVHKMNITR